MWWHKFLETLLTQFIPILILSVGLQLYTSRFFMKRHFQRGEAFGFLSASHHLRLMRLATMELGLFGPAHLLRYCEAFMMVQFHERGSAGDQAWARENAPREFEAILKAWRENQAK